MPFGRRTRNPMFIVLKRRFMIISDENKLCITTDYLIPILVNAIKELSEKIEILEKKIK